MIYTLFFSRLKELSPQERTDYESRAGALRRLAEEAHPGFVDMKTYVAEDGERLTVVRFRDAGAQERWRREPVHREAQGQGRGVFYEEYRIAVCELVREHGWRRHGVRAEVGR